MIFRLTALTAILLSVCPALAAPDPFQDQSTAGVRPDGRGDRPKDVPPRASLIGAAGTNGITYHGGPVMLGTTKIYYIWYGNWGSGTGPAAVNILTTLAQSIGGSPYFNINTTYYDGSNTAVSNSVSYAGSITDNYSQGTSLSDAAIAAVVSNAISSGGLPKDPNAVYFVLTSADVTATSGFCTVYCGWHDVQTIAGTSIKYSFIGNADRCPSSCAAQTTGPNGTTGADAMASIIAHELEEAVTDPNLNAWYDSSGNENADKCAWTFGTTYTAPNGAPANMFLGGRDYLIQRNWVNAAGGYCALSYTPTPDFALSGSPSTQTVAPGSPATYTVTVTPSGGFSGSVNLSASGLPSGATASFSPNPATTSSTLTITTTAATPVGIFALTITGVNGALTHTAGVTLKVALPPDFTVSASPSSNTAVAGSSAGYTVTVGALNGFTGTTGFSVSGMPSGVTAGFSPATVTGSGSTALTLSVGGATAAGTYPLTITATSGTLVHTANISLTVTLPATGGTLTGSMAAPTGPVPLTTQGTLDWAHWGLATVTDYNHKANVGSQIPNFTALGAAASRYANNGVGFTWTDGTPTAAATNTTTGVYISGQNNGFRLIVPADTTLKTLKLYLGAWHTQGKLVAQLSDGSAPVYTDTSLVNTVSPTSLGVYTLNFSAASAGQTLTVTFTQFLSGTGNVTLQAATLSGGVPGPDFTLSALPGSQSVPAGQSAPYTATVTAVNGFSGSVGFGVTGLPTGVTAGFSPSTVTGSGTSTMTLTVAANTTPGTYPLVITGTSGILSHTANVSLTVSGAPDFTLGATPASQTVVAGQNAPYTATVTAVNGFSGSVGFGVTGLPTGVTAGFSPSTVTGSGTSTMNLTVAANTVPGTYPLVITGTSGSLSHTANVSLTVTGFTLSASPASQTVVAGQNAPYTATVTAVNGFSGSVGFGVTGLPTGVTAGFSPSTVTGSGTSTMTLTVATSTAPGTYPLVITGTSGSLSHTANVSLTVTGFTLSASPASQTVVAGQSAPYTATVTALNGFGGSVGFGVTGLPTGVTAGFSPTTVTGSGSTTMTLTVAANTVAGTYPLVITGTSGSLSRTANVSLTVTAGVTGVLTGSMATPTGPVQLTQGGTLDWAHWGLNTATDYDHKAAVTPQIGNFSVVGSGTVSRYINNSVGFTWTDGTPTATVTNSTTGVYIVGQNNGFRLTLPADATTRTVKVYVGAWHTQGRMVAHLSDNSAADYVDTSLVNTVSPTSLGVYTLTYHAASAGQTLTITFTQNLSGTGNVTLQAATLQ